MIPNDFFQKYIQLLNVEEGMTLWKLLQAAEPENRLTIYESIVLMLRSRMPDDEKHNLVDANTLGELTMKELYELTEDWDDCMLWDNFIWEYLNTKKPKEKKTTLVVIE